MVSSVSFPKPGMAKICSVTTTPEMSAPIWSPTIVVIVISEFRSACFMITDLSERPFARAVRM